MSSYGCIVPIAWPVLDDALAHARGRIATGADSLDATITLGDRIVTSAAALPGEDAFEARPHGGFYSRLHATPYAMVAGWKNFPSLLAATFEHSWDATRPTHYVVTGRRSVSERCDALLTHLFFGARHFPPSNGAERRWMATDDPWICGHLIPAEVTELTALLPEMIGAWSRADDDELLPLFVDRVERAAAAGLAIVALQGFL